MEGSRARGVMTMDPQGLLLLLFPDLSPGCSEPQVHFGKLTKSLSELGWRLDPKPPVHSTEQSFKECPARVGTEHHVACP